MSKPKNENTADLANTLTVNDLAVRWACRRQAIYEAIREGRLHAFRVGKRWLRVKLTEVERFEQAQGKAA